MHILLKIFVAILLLGLVMVVGAEVVALHSNALPSLGSTVPPVVVRKSSTAIMPTKTVRALPTHTRPHRVHRKEISADKQKSPAS